MVVYLVCFDLSATPAEQRSQILYWLQFLHSSIPTLSRSHTTNNNNNSNTNTTTSDSRNWRVMIVGLKSDLMRDTTFTTKTIQSWQSQMPNLPLFEQQLFHVSSLQIKQSVQDLLSSIELVCSQIFSTHAILIPRSFRKLLHSINDINIHSPNSPSILPIQQLYDQLKGQHDNMDLSTFTQAIKYLHMIGQIVFLQNGMVCRSPTTIPKLLSKFISPVEVRDHLLAEDSDVVQILTQKQIGCVLQINPSSHDARCVPLLTVQHFPISYFLLFWKKDWSMRFNWWLNFKYASNWEITMKIKKQSSFFRVLDRRVCFFFPPSSTPFVFIIFTNLHLFFFRHPIPLFQIWRWWIVFFLWHSVLPEKHGICSRLFLSIWSLHIEHPASIFYSINLQHHTCVFFYTLTIKKDFQR